MNNKHKAAQAFAKSKAKQKSPPKKTNVFTDLTGSRTLGTVFGLIGLMLGVSVEIEHEHPPAPALPPPADDLELNPETGAFEPKKHGL